MIPLDDNLRPQVALRSHRTRRMRPRPAITSKAISLTEYGSPKCLVKIGCWGPGGQLQRPQSRGWMTRHLAAAFCVGGICIGCTMPGFPDKFMPFMDEPPGAKLSTSAVQVYGRTIRSLRSFTNNTVNREPKWRHKEGPLTTGYKPTTY